jgi:ArsR family transcriptional regulator
MNGRRVPSQTLIGPSPSLHDRGGSFPFVVRRTAKGLRMHIPQQVSHLRKRAPRADAELARFAKALASPVRARIVRLLAAQDRCMYGSIAAVLPLASSTVSQHLQVLKAAGLIHGEVSGPRVCYCIDRKALARGKALIAAL